MGTLMFLRTPLRVYEKASEFLVLVALELTRRNTVRCCIMAKILKVDNLSTTLRVQREHTKVKSVFSDAICPGVLQYSGDDV